MTQEAIIDNTIITEFVKAVQKVLNITTGEQISEQIRYLNKSEDLPGEISASIELEGDLSGKVIVSFTKEYARTIASRIIGCEESELSDEDVKEGMGEIVNQVTGSVRTSLWDFGYRFNISIPEVTNSSISQIKTEDRLPVHIIVFKSSKSIFSTQISVRECNLL